jgi:hypothetical protein
MNLEQVKLFKEEYEDFLRGSNVNLGRNGSKNKEAFIAEAMKRVLDFVLAESDGQTEKPVSPGRGHLVDVKPIAHNKLVDSKGVAAMTDVKSRQADEDLGRAPNFDD